MLQVATRNLHSSSHEISISLRELTIPFDGDIYEEMHFINHDIWLLFLFFISIQIEILIQQTHISTLSNQQSYSSQ